ncbi:hypothetical protein CEXT_350611 [Caerostris extrusa]|uniref:Uncharacterized protein n=1 Tax=Caerostris extrusa TaxID=172846 RepID=A0AAV4X6S8_CAEEX|nr:hypothetical protein CEXT_350611 [Caerostris extrusa]
MAPQHISGAASYGEKEAQTQNMSKYHPRTSREFRRRNRIRSFSRRREQNKKEKEGKECAIVGGIVEKRDWHSSIKIMMNGFGIHLSCSGAMRETAFICKQKRREIGK